MTFEVRAGKGVVVARQFYDSTAMYTSRDYQTLRTRLCQDGYVFLRGVLPPEDVKKACVYLMDQLHLDHPHTTLADGRLQPEASCSTRPLGLLGRQDLANSKLVCAVLESPRLASLVGNLLLEDDLKTTCFKWLRAVGPGEFTGLHTDRVFLGQNSESLITVWLPLHATKPADGGMIVCRATHRSRAFADLRRSYGASQVGVDGTASGWLTNDGSGLASFLPTSSAPGSIDWRAGNFEEGDLIVLHQDLLHMTACNTADSFRISCDTRWQPCAEPANPTLGSWRQIE